MNITNITYNTTHSDKSNNNINIIVIIIILLFFSSFLISFIHYMICRNFTRLPNTSPIRNNNYYSDSDSDYEDRYYTRLSNSQFSRNNTLRVEMITSLESKSIQTKEILTFSNINKYTIFCSICQEKQLNTIKIDCNHHFCEECIKEYLKINNNCPICRSKINHIYKIKVLKI